MSTKLYTEEQVYDAISKAFRYKSNIEILNSLTPIELPTDAICVNCDEQKPIHSICMDCIIKIGKQNIELPTDEEIERELESHEHMTLELEAGFRAGASYVIYKIQGGNK